MLALGLYRGRVMLVDEASGEVRWNVKAHSGGHAGARATLSPDGKFVASVGRLDAQWKLWNAANGALHRVGATHDGTGTCICEVPAFGPRLLQERCPVVAHTAAIHVVVFSSCGGRFATGGLDDAVVVWDAQSGEAVHKMQNRFGSVWSLSFSGRGEGSRLASGSVDGWIRVYDVTTGALLRTIQESHRVLLNIHLSPTDSHLLASAGGDGKIHLWDVDSGEKIRSMQGRKFAVFSPDGRTIATASAEAGKGDVRLIDAVSGTTRLMMSDPNGSVALAAFAADDGRKLATVSHDGTCKVWHSSTGALLRTIELGESTFSVSFGRDWVRDAQRGVAFAMRHHPRLGAESQVLELEEGVVRMILDRV